MMTFRSIAGIGCLCTALQKWLTQARQGLMPGQDAAGAVALAEEGAEPSAASPAEEEEGTGITRRLKQFAWSRYGTIHPPRLLR